MESTYIVVFNDQKKGEAAASLLCEQMNSGALIISAVATRDSVHYLLGRVEADPSAPMTKDDIQVIRDNLDAEERVLERDNE